MLLGSVFDANSLGKWIYDWTVFCRGTDAPISHMAGDLWLLLIELGGKIKHAENTMPKIRSAENKELVEAVKGDEPSGRHAALGATARS